MKEKIKKLDTPIIYMLPSGAIKQLAERFEVNPKNMSKILKGEFGDERHLRLIIIEALEIIKSKAEERRAYVETTYNKLGLNPLQAARSN